MAVEKLIGFDATECHRTFAGGGKGKSMDSICPRKGLPSFSDRYNVRYPLREWGFDREDCGRIIVEAGLPLPPKSACFFCPASKGVEIEWLRVNDPELYVLAIEMERIYREGPHFRGDSAMTVRARHKITRETYEAEVTASDKAEARKKFRVKMKDTARPYRWDVSVSPAVVGLGRSVAWSAISEPFEV